MKGIRIASALAVLALAAAAADAQTPMRVRGTITAIDGNVLSVKARDGKDLKVHVTDDVGVTVAKAIKFEDIKQGDYVGSATTKRADGALVALEVHYLPPAVPPGHIPWDLAPGSMMTNANVEAMVTAAGKRELTLKYKDGMQKILVPDGVPIVRAVPGNRADLKPGEYIWTGAQVAPDGKITASRIQVSKDGVKPPH
ncbi:MAG TPA: hypothetical protein VJM14_17300 [Burkholderiales bacterium]|nr:hypothetical protein [Burkholderiales bacterium]